MMKKERSPEFKKKVALEAIKGLKTVSEVASEFEVHPVQVAQWKKQLIEQASLIFESPKKAKNRAKNQAASEEHLHKKIGKLTVEVDWLKKKLGIE